MEIYIFQYNFTSEKEEEEEAGMLKGRPLSGYTKGGGGGVQSTLFFIFIRLLEHPLA